MSMRYFDPVAYEESVSAVTATPSVELGARRFSNGEEYVYGYNAGPDCYPKYGVKIITGASGYSFANTALTDVANPCMGVVKHATIAAASYGWVMTKGFTSLIYHADSTVTADYVALALTTGGTFHQSRPITDAVGVGTFNVVAMGLGVNTASGGTVYGFVRTVF